MNRLTRRQALKAGALALVAPMAMVRTTPVPQEAPPKLVVGELRAIVTQSPLRVRVMVAYDDGQGLREIEYAAWSEQDLTAMSESV